MVSLSYPSPKIGASLMLSFRPKTVFVVGSNTLAAARAFAALESEAEVIVFAKGGIRNACDELQYRGQEGQVTLLDLSTPPSSSDIEDSDAEALEAYIHKTSPSISLVCVTDTVLGLDSTVRRSKDSAQNIRRLCQARGIPVNITDMPELCDFTFASTHRFSEARSGEPSPLQIAVTTNGQGCRLAGRIRRELVSSLPKEVGRAVKKMGVLRGMAKTLEIGDDAEQELNEEAIISTPNRPVPQRQKSKAESEVEVARRRMKWVSQVSEYWPIERLANMTDEDMSILLNGNDDMSSSATTSRLSHHPDGQNNGSESRHSLQLAPSVTPKKGRILLVGSGPGHPSLLTVATHTALTRHADLVLSDKLVPAAVLALIPMHVEVRIARKFPGNAEGAQNEMIEAAIEAANRGLTVVRLKQGDPTVYGRAGEEVLYFRSHGFEPLIIPGVSSALAGPTMSGIPVTQRGVAESFIVCTGVGRQGKEVKLPGYERSRTLLILMGVARLPQVVKALTNAEDTSGNSRDGPAYPSHLPIAVIERASMPDQRSICSTLSSISAALESVGEQRPPGMIVVGWSVLALWGQGDVTVLDSETCVCDEERVRQWLGGNSWRIREGLDPGWEAL